MFCYTKQGHRQNIIVTEKKKKKNQDIRQNIIPYGHRNWMRACTGCYSLLLADRGNWIPPGKRFTLFMTSPFWWKSQLSVGGFVFICIYIFICVSLNTDDKQHYVCFVSWSSPSGQYVYSVCDVFYLFFYHPASQSSEYRLVHPVFFKG